MLGNCSPSNSFNCQQGVFRGVGLTVLLFPSSNFVR